MLIREILDIKAARVGLRTTVQHAVELFVLTKVNDLAVIDEQGALVGVLSEGDLMRKVLPDLEQVVEAGGSLVEAFETFLRNGQALVDEPIESLVIRNPIVISPDDELLVAAQVMETKGIRRLPVVERGKFVGTVSRADIMWALVCKDTGRG